MKQPSERQIKLFKRYLNKALGSSIIDQMKEQTIIDIFKYNFDSNLALAEKILFFKYDEIEIGDYKITNHDKAVSMFESFRDKGLPVILITDNDSDGSQAQAAMYAAKDYSEDFDNVDIEFAQNLNENKNVHGITVEVVEAWVKKKEIDSKSEFLVMTADNGIQSKDEIELILKKFPNAKVMITDHHLPDDNLTPKENNRITIYNPKYKPQGFLKENPHLNISGAATLCNLIKGIVERSPKENLRSKYLNTILDGVFKNSNAMDFVKASLKDYPLKPHDVDQNSTIRALLNINNSVKSFVDRDIPSTVLDRAVELNPDINRGVVEDSVLKVKELNHYSGILLSICEEYKKMNPSERQLIDSQLLNSKIQEKILSEDSYEKDNLSINNNYIEQLRPFIFYAMSNPHKDDFLTKMSEIMIDVFKDLKKSERGLIDEMKKLDLMHVVKRENTSILYAKDTDIIKDLRLGRKLLMKIYNEHNRGTMLFMTGEEPNSKEGHIITNGSGRSIEMPLQEFCEKMNDLMPEVKFRAKGHDMAAGIFIESKKRLTQDKINMLADLADQVVENYKNEKLNQDTDYNNEVYYLCDTTNIHEILEFNTLVAGFLPNQKSIEPLLKINRSTRFINRETGLPETVGEMLKSNSYGYKTIEINFHGDVVILGTEVIRKLAENNYKDYVKLTQMSGGALIAQSIVERDKVNPQNLVKIKSEFQDNTKRYEDSIKKLEENNYVIKMSREDLMDNDLIKRNKAYGDQEFAEFESMILSIMDKEKLDMYGVLDTEGLGFGAAFCFNVGILGIKRKEGVGIEIPLSEYKEAEEAGNLKSLREKYVNGKRINNIKVEGDKIIVNREIEADMLAVLLKDKNTYIPDPISYLTAITQSMNNKYAKSVEFADDLLTDFIKGMRVLLVAHNAGYDIGVMLASNLKKFTSSFFTDKCKVVDSASIAKQDAIGYADMEVTQIGNLQSALFFDNEHSDYRLSNFIQGDDDFTFPSIRGDFILERKGKDYYLLDKENRIHQKLPYSDEDMRDGSALYSKPMPRNRVKYSIQYLLNNMAIRNMLLDQIDKKVELVEPDEDLLKIGIEDDFIDFCAGYNFGGDFSKNLYNYLSHLKSKDIERYKDFKSKIFEDDTAAEKYFELSADEIKKENLKIRKDAQKEIIKVEKKYRKLIDKNPDEEKYVVELSKKVQEIEEKMNDQLLSFDGLECLSRNVNNFISKNREIYSKYINNWEYQLILSVHDPMKKVLAKKDLEKIEYQTGLSKERIIKLHNEIFEYKKKIGIQNEPFYIKELHNNLDKDGDMGIEHFPVVLALISKYYNRYSNNSEQASDVLLNSYRDTMQSLFRRFHVDMISETLSINSATKKQLDNVAKNPSGNSDYIHTAQNTDKVRIQNDYLAPGMSIVAEKSLQEVSLDDINEIEEDLNLIISYNLLKNSKVKIITVTDYVDRYIKSKNIEEAGELFYENHIYNCNDNDEIKDKLEAEDISPKLMEDIVDLYRFYKKTSLINSQNDDILRETKDEISNDVVEAYKRVYDKIGYFYVDNTKKEVKDIIDSIYANLFSNESRFKINPKSITENVASNVRDISNEVIRIIESMDGIDIDPDVLNTLQEKLNQVPVIDENLKELIKRSSEIREEMNSENFDIRTLNEVLPLYFLGSKKMDPIKEITSTYKEIHRIRTRNRMDEINRNPEREKKCKVGIKGGD